MQTVRSYECLWDRLSGGRGGGGKGKSVAFKNSPAGRAYVHTYKIVYSKDAGLRGLFYVEARESRTHVFIYGGRSNIAT